MYHCTQYPIEKHGLRVFTNFVHHIHSILVQLEIELLLRNAAGKPLNSATTQLWWERRGDPSSTIQGASTVDRYFGAAYCLVHCEATTLA